MFQPLITEIQQKYKNNPQKQQEELMKLQQEHGYNPMGGCMPTLTMLVCSASRCVLPCTLHLRRQQ